MVELNRRSMPRLGWGASIPRVLLTHEELGNGDRVSLLVGGSERAVMLWVYFPLGAGAGGGQAVARGAAELALRGTARRGGDEVFARFDSLGTHVEGFATRDYVGFRLLSMEETFSESLSLLLELLEAPAYTELSFLSWQKRTAVGLAVASQTAGYVAQRGLWESMLARPHRYQEVATAAMVESLRREDIARYYSTNIAGCRALVLACGPSGSAWRGELRDLFGQRSSGREVCPPGEAMLACERGSTVVSESEQREQASVQLGCVLPKAGHADSVELEILVSLLGGFMGSRLMQKLREEKGYTYGVRAAVSYFQDGGVLQVSSEVGNNYVEECVQDVRGEFARLREELVGEEELVRLRSYLFGRLLRGMDGVYATLSGVRKYELNAGYGVDYVERYVAALRGITAVRLREEIGRAHV